MIRLTSTKTGHPILREFDYFPRPTQDPPEFTLVLRELRDLIRIAPIPRNVHPEHNRGGRLTPATAFLKRINKKADDVVFVNAAAYHGNGAFAAVAVSSSQWTLNAATVLARHPEVVEQVAIALAMLEDRRQVIFSDSRPVIKAYERGVVSD